MSSRTVRRFPPFALLLVIGCAPSGASSGSSQDAGEEPGVEASTPEDASINPVPSDARATHDASLSNALLDGTTGETLDGISDGAPSTSPDVGESFASDSAGCNPSPAIHDDFESGSLGAWQVTDPYGNPLAPGNSQYSVTVDTTRAHSGTHSLKVSNGGLIGVAPPSPGFYGRVWTWLGSSPGEVPNGGHWGAIIGVGTSDSSQSTEVRMGGQFGILIDNYSTNDDIVLSDPTFFNDGMDGGTKAIVGAWTCVEFYFGKDSLRTWVNGAEITSLDVTPSTVWAHGMKAPWSPEYSSIRIGYANYNAAAIDVWYDDVAIDANRICCE